MHISEFIEQVESVFQRLQSPEMVVFVPVDENLQVLSEDDKSKVTSIRFTFTRAPVESVAGLE